MTDSKKIAAAVPLLMIFVVLWVYPVAFKDPRFSSYIRFTAAVAILFSIVLWKINKWVSGFVVLSFFSSLVPTPTVQSMNAFEAVLIGVLWFYFTVKYIKIDHVKYVLDGICVISLFGVGLILLQAIGYDPIYHVVGGSPGSTSSTGFLTNPNEAGAFFAISLPAFFRKKWCWTTPLIFLGLTCAHSTGGALAAAVMTLVYFFLKDIRLNFNWLKSILLILVVGWFIFFIIGVDQYVPMENLPKSPHLQFQKKTTPTSIVKTFGVRGWVWEKGVKLYFKGSQTIKFFSEKTRKGYNVDLKGHPLIGFGIGHWKVIWQYVQNPFDLWFAQAHNEYLQGLFEMGIMFPLIVIGYFVRVVKKYKKETILPAIAI
jgi:hypothetical protein